MNNNDDPRDCSNSTSITLDYLLKTYEDGDDDNIVLPRGLTGLCNLGNTCYMNAALQALSNCPPFCNFFRNCLFERLYLTETNQTRLPVSSALSDLARSMWSAEHRSFVAPNVLLTKIRTQCAQFRGWSQQDSQEFIRCFLDILHNELRRPIYFDEKKHKKAESASNDSSDDSNGEEVFETADSGCSSDMEETSQNDNKSSASGRADTEIVEHEMPKVLSYTSLVEDVFNGELESSVKCLSCHTVSRTTEKFQDLSLSIPSLEELERLQQQESGVKDNATGQRDRSVVSMVYLLTWLAVSPIQGVLSYVYNNFFSAAISLDDCLKSFFSPDHLRGDDMYSCEKCAKLRNGVKTCRITKLPEILCIHLKRFRHDYMYSTKVSTSVTFPICDLDLSEFLCDQVDVSSALTPREYDLCAFVTHRGGGSEYGHYLAYCRNEFDNNWYEYDDSTVTRIDAAEVLNKQAYVLFYQKRSTDKGELLKENLLDILRTNNNQQFKVPAQWIGRFLYFSAPGSVSNKAILCPHGDLLPSPMKRHDADLVHVSREAWEFMNTHYGNESPVEHSALQECHICYSQWEHMQNRKNREHRTMRLLDERARIAGDLSLEVTYDDYLPLNCVPLHWWRSWVDFVKNPHAEPPGPIDNSSLLIRMNSFDDSAVSSMMLRRGVKFEAISRELWLYLVGIYGGGPEVFRTVGAQFTREQFSQMLESVNLKISEKIEQYLAEERIESELEPRMSVQFLRMGVSGSFEPPNHVTS